MKDAWVKAAMRDENMVAELLLRLRQSSSSASSSSTKLPPPPPPVTAPVIPPWGVRQPRSTPFRKYGAGGAGARGSPRTPLSWSGGAATASPSDGGCDEPSVGFAPFDPLSNSRSKNFSQLKDEETELLKERVNLKRELDSIHVNLEEQRNRSGNFKRIKLDLNQQSAEGGVLSMEPEVRFTNYRSQMEISTTKVHQSILPRQAIQGKRALANSCGVQEVAETNKGGFVLPDLNMPVEEDEIAAELW